MFRSPLQEASPVWSLSSECATPGLEGNATPRVDNDASLTHGSSATPRSEHEDSSLCWQAGLGSGSVTKNNNQTIRPVYFSTPLSNSDSVIRCSPAVLIRNISADIINADGEETGFLEAFPDTEADTEYQVVKLENDGSNGGEDRSGSLDGSGELCYEGVDTDSSQVYGEEDRSRDSQSNELILEGFCVIENVETLDKHSFSLSENNENTVIINSEDTVCLGPEKDDDETNITITSLQAEDQTLVGYTDGASVVNQDESRGSDVSTDSASSGNTEIMDTGYQYILLDDSPEMTPNDMGAASQYSAGQGDNGPTAVDQGMVVKDKNGLWSPYQGDAAPGSMCDSQMELARQARCMEDLANKAVSELSNPMASP